MPFPEAIKDKVRQRARYRCCRCYEVGIDVHHIIPEAGGGPDTIDNAAPLCQNCHDRFGDNPKKRKEIRGMRDLLYEIMKEKWPTADDRPEQLNATVLRSETGTAGDLVQIADGLRAEIDRLKVMLDSPTLAEIRHIATAIAGATPPNVGVPGYKAHLLNEPPHTPATPTNAALRVHKAYFLNEPQNTPYYFVNILNASQERQVTITHVWFATDPAVSVLTRQLPVRIAPNNQWETWVEASKLPDANEPPETLARALLADGTCLYSTPRGELPGAGFIPG